MLIYEIITYITHKLFSDMSALISKWSTCRTCDQWGLIYNNSNETHSKFSLKYMPQDRDRNVGYNWHGLIKLLK